MKHGIGWTWLLGILLGMVPGSSALAGPDTGGVRHVLSLRVLVDGEVVMSPNLRLRPGVPASIALAGESGEPGYALQVRLSPDPDRPGSYSTLEATLWKGDYQRERPLLDTRAVLDWQRIDKAMPIASVRSRDGRSVELQVISHARVLPSTTTPLAQPCTDARAAVDAAPRDDAAPADAPPVCCSASCGDGSGHTLHCCGAEQCCACGACCSNA